MRQLKRLSRPILFVFVVLAVTVAVSGCGLIRKQKPQTAPTLVASLKDDALNSDPVVQDFKQRLDHYLTLQKKVAKDSLPLQATKDPAKITAAQEVLAEKIRAIRKNAQQGDIFTPQVAAKFRQLMRPELKGTTGAKTKEVIAGDEADEVPHVALKVNGKYTSGTPLPTVPPNILANLPRVPGDVEYRIVGNTLILRDVDADIIVDFTPNAIR